MAHATRQVPSPDHHTNTRLAQRFLVGVAERRDLLTIFLWYGELHFQRLAAANVYSVCQFNQGPPVFELIRCTDWLAIGKRARLRDALRHNHPRQA